MRGAPNGTPPTVSGVPVARRRDLVRWLLRRRKRYQVEGRSMWPGLVEGDDVLVHPRRPPRPGDVVVLVHPHRPGTRLVKRLVRHDPKGLWVEGDNPDASTDSRHFGPIPRLHLLGTVIGRFPRPGDPTC